MKVEVDSIEVTSGEFSIIQDGLSPSGGATLSVIVDYCLKKGSNVVAIGKAGNVPGLPTETKLSDLTLRKFQEFYISLEQDLSSTLKGERVRNDAEDGRVNELEDILRSTTE